MTVKAQHTFNRPGSFWTAERDASLKRMWIDGLTCSQIAARMGAASRNAVIGRVRRLGLAFRGQSHASGPAQRLYRKQSRRKLKAQPPPKPISPAAQVIKEIKRDGLPIPPPAETDIPRVAFVDLEAHHCRFIALAEPTGPFVPQFCGERVAAPSLAYCEAHVARCYGNPNPSRPVPAKRELQVA